MRAFFSIALTLFFVIDAFGIIPTYVNLIKRVERKKQPLIALRELLIALGIMILFHYVGELLFNLLHLSTTTVQISGGIIIFLIAIRLIFPPEDGKQQAWGEGTPFIVPIATPLIAGPSLLAVIMIFSQEIANDLLVLSAIFAAWALSAVILLFAKPIHKLITEKGLHALQRLMGLIVGLIAVQLFLKGVKGLL